MPSEEGQTRRVRARTCDGDTTYTYTEKVPVAVGAHIEREKIITRNTYEQLLEFRIANLSPVSKTRKCFFWKGKFFELDIFDDPVKDCILEVELSERDEKVELPDFVTLVKEVTGDPAYSNRAIAERFSGR
jgi:CYTH domain-containing protein